MNTRILLIVLLLSAAVLVRGQTEDLGKNEISVWGGFSPDSNTFLKTFGRTPNARWGIVGFRYARRFENGDRLSLKYTADVIPAAVLNVPESSSPPAARRTAFAFGFSPVGLQANFRPRKKYQPFIGISAGFLYFDKNIPNGLGTRFNFTVDVGGGLEIRLPEKRAFTIGYKYYHISNGNRGVINPGIDNNLIYVGYTFFSK